MANQAQALDFTLVLPTATPAVANEIAFDSFGRLVYYNSAAGRTAVMYDDLDFNTFTYQGTLKVVTGTSRWYVETACVFNSIRASVGTAPTGASIICDVKKNGTSIFNVTTANRPTIAASGFTALSGVPDTTSFAAGDYITVDILQVGSTIAGADLTVNVKLRIT